MSIQLTNADVGKKFRIRDGNVVTVVQRSTASCTNYPFFVQHGYTTYSVTETGKEFVSAGLPGRDLIERVEEPVEPVWKDAPLERIEAKGIQNVLRTLPSGREDRKGVPITTGCIDYFPLALAEIARISKAGNDQHNPGQPLHWARHKSADHADCIARHLIERGTLDSDGKRHTAKMAWRAVALLQEELEAEAGWTPTPEA